MGESMKNILSRIKREYASIQEFRRGIWEKHSWLGISLLILYPFVIIFLTEVNHIQSYSGTLMYFLRNPNVFLFVLFYQLLLFIAFLFITRSALIATALNSLILFTFSCIELYKFEASGTHFTVTDIMMVSNLRDLTGFASIYIKPILVVNFIILLLFSAAIYISGIKPRFKILKSAAVGAVSGFLFACFIVSPALAEGATGFFEITRVRADNSFTENESFNDTKFLTFFIESATAVFRNAIRTPEAYSAARISELLLPAREADPEAIKPNIIFILSESFADMRLIDPNLSDEPFINFDRFSSEGHSGRVIVPTFGGYTARTEFELLFGLPIRSLKSPTIPHMRITSPGRHPLFAFPLKYRALGYTTSYIHPFNRTFYNRSEIYPHFGFDNLFFSDNLTVPVEHFGNYISDRTVFAQALEIMRSTPGRDYIFITTMQNHVPYVEDEHSDGRFEYEQYLRGITESDRALGMLYDMLVDFEEPVVLVFLGDHFPFFVRSGNIYEQIGINSGNISVLYEQSFFVWSNFDLDKSSLKRHDMFSLFYLPGLIHDLLGLPMCPVTNTILAQLPVSPVYTQGYAPNIPRNYILELFTYDLIRGRRYALAYR